MNKEILGLMQLELKMIRRNKKPLQNFIQIIVSYFVAIGGLIFLYNKHNDLMSMSNFSVGFLFYLLGNGFVLFHGLYLMTWESTFFEFFNIQKIDFRNYFIAKYYLFAASVLIFSVIATIIFSFIDLRLIVPVISYSLFSLGTVAFLILIYALHNNERANLNKSIFINYEGYGMWQYIVLLILIALPIGTASILNVFVSDFYIRMIILAGIGITGIIAQKQWFHLIMKVFKNRKYHIIEKFSEVLE